MRGRGWLLLSCVALVGVLVLAAFPARTYVEQRRQRGAVADRIRSLSAENRQLEGRAQQLQTDAEVERLAREQYGLVRPGEEVYAVLGPPVTTPPPPAPPPLPRDDRSWWDKGLDLITSLL